MTTGARERDVSSSIRDVRIPDEVVEAFDHLGHYLTEDGKQTLVSELLRALNESAKLGSVAPVNEVLEAWYRTLILVQQDDYRAAMEDPCDEEPLTLREMLATIGR